MGIYGLMYILLNSEKAPAVQCFFFFNFFFQKILVSETRRQDIKLDLKYPVAFMFLIFLCLERIKVCI